MIIAPLWLETLSESGPIWPAFVGPCAASTRARVVASPIFCRGRSCIVQVRIDATWRLRMKPISAPLACVTVHIVQAPRVGRVTTDFGGPAERWPLLRTVIWLSFEVRLLAADLVAKRGGGSRTCSASVFPLCFGRKPDRPIYWEFSRRADIRTITPPRQHLKTLVSRYTLNHLGQY